VIFLWVAISAALILIHTAPFPMVLDAGSGSFWKVQVPPGRKIVYLTFDDGPNPTATPALLDVLKEKKARATFFLIDKYVTAGTASMIRRMFEEGHGVAQHSADRWLMIQSPASISRTIRAGGDRIESLVGRRPCAIFRPHGGWRSLTLLRGLSRAGYRLAGWSWMSWDWYWFRQRTGERVARQVMAHASPGQIIVIHDGHHIDPKADRRYAIEATNLIISGLRARGYEFGVLCESLDGFDSRNKNEHAADSDGGHQACGNEYGQVTEPVDDHAGGELHEHVDDALAHAGESGNAREHLGRKQIAEQSDEIGSRSGQSESRQANQRQTR
jgi:peptidoglycan-N-acetylglucosamine deacetylase